MWASGQRSQDVTDKSNNRMMDLQIVETIILVLHVLAALAIIGLVLIQHGKGADMGSGFGSGASATVYGSGGAGNFLSKSNYANRYCNAYKSGACFVLVMHFQ